MLDERVEEGRMPLPVALLRKPALRGNKTVVGHIGPEDAFSVLVVELRTHVSLTTRWLMWTVWPGGQFLRFILFEQFARRRHLTGTP